MTKNNSFPQHVLLSGTFDRRMASFSRWIRKNYKAVTGGLSTVKYDSAAFDEWKIGNLTTDGRSDALIEPYEAAVWFALTPFERCEKKAGNTSDIALMDAIQFIRAVKKAEKQGRTMRVVLVIRMFPEDCRALGEIYDFWWQLYKLFKKECPNLCILRISPEISKNDALSLALYERAQYTRRRAGTDGDDIAWLNLTRPILPGVLNPAIAAALTEKMPAEHIIQGNRVMSYDEWFGKICDEMPGRYAFIGSRIRINADSEMRLRSRLLKETVKFHAMDETEHYGADGDSACMNAVADFVDDAADSRDKTNKLLLKPLKSKDNIEFSFVRRISDAPRRSLADIAELMTYWLPLYFRRSLNLEEISDKRVICKLSHIPLFEIERRDSGDFLCQLFLRWPWKRHIETKISITLAATPGDDDKPGILLIACENIPDSLLWRSLFSGIAGTFGKFIREYS